MNCFASRSSSNDGGAFGRFFLDHDDDSTHSFAMQDEPSEPSPRHENSPLRIYDATGVIAPIHTLIHVLGNMRRHNVINTHTEIHRRLAIKCAHKERSNLNKLLSRIEYFPDDTLPAYYGCIRIKDAPLRVEVGRRQIYLTKALRWLCTTLPDNDLEFLNDEQPEYEHQIVSMCDTTGCVNPEHYNERCLAQQMARERRSALFDNVLFDEISWDKHVQQMYMADLNKGWIKTERQLARDANVHTFIESMLPVDQQIFLDDMARVPDFVLEHTAAQPLLFKTVETRTLGNAGLLRERVLKPIACDAVTDMVCDPAS